jgi:hypothetical protein
MTLSAVSVEQAGEASGVNGTLRTVGATLGSAVLGAILLSGIAGNVTTGIQTSNIIPTELKAPIVTAVSAQASNIEFGGGANFSKDIPSNVVSEIKNISDEATVGASRTSLWWGLLFVAISFFLALKLPNLKNIETGKSLAQTQVH